MVPLVLKSTSPVSVYQALGGCGDMLAVRNRSAIMSFDNARKHKAKRKQNRSASLNARLSHFLSTRCAIPICFPTKFRYRFSCKKCTNTIPVEPEGIVRNASSIDEAFTNFNAFAKTVEPQTIKCQCGHENGYHRRDVFLVPTEDYQPAFRRLERLGVRFKWPVIKT